MDAAARIRVENLHGHDTVVERSAAAPLAVRLCDDRVLLASTAAAPVGGDHLDIGIDIGSGASMIVGSVAAMMIWPSPNGAESSLRTVCDIGPGGHLDLVPEPTVSVAGSVHRSTTRVRLDPTATCRIVEEVSLGRSGEAAGRLTTSWRVERAGRVLVHHDEIFGSDHSITSVGVGSARHVVTAIVVGTSTAASATVVEPDRAAVRLPLADDAEMVLAVAGDRPGAHDLLASLAPDVITGT